MNEVTESLCPACRVALFDSGVGEFTLLGCGLCGGQWLDNEGCHRLAEGRISEQSKDLAEQASDLGDARKIQGETGSQPQRNQGPYRAEADGEPGTRICPICQGSLKPAPVQDAGVEVDVCAAHGTFFDPHELLKVARAVEFRSVAHAAEAAEQSRRLEEAIAQQNNGKAAMAIGWDLLLGPRHRRSVWR